MGQERTFAALEIMTALPPITDIAASCGDVIGKNAITEIALISVFGSFPNCLTLPCPASAGHFFSSSNVRFGSGTDINANPNNVRY